MRKLLSIIVVLSLALTGSAQVFNEGSLYYKIISGTGVEVTGHPSGSYKGRISIPQTASYNGTTYLVRRIGDKAFENASVTSIQIPNNVTAVGTGAFDGCTSLKSVVVSSNAIANGNYSATNNLKNIFGEQVTYYSFNVSVGAYALYGASNVVRVILGGSANAIGKYAFYGTSVKSFAIPTKVTSIGELALEPVDSLYINSQTFCNSKPDTPFLKIVGKDNLKKILFGPNVTSISNGAFDADADVAYSLMPTIGEVDFSNVKSFDGNILLFKAYRNLTFDAEVEDLSKISLAYYTLGQYSGYTKNVSTVYNLYFNGNVSSSILGNVFFSSKLPADVSCIVLKNIESLENDFFSDKLQLNEKLRLTNVKLPSNLKTIGERCFKGQDYLKDVELPEGLDSVGMNAFEQNKSLTSITIPSTLELVPSQCFYNCENLTTVVIKEGVKTIGGNAFDKCPKLSVLEIPSTMTDCYSLWTSSESSSQLVFLKDMSDNFPIKVLNKDCFIVTKTEERAKLWRKKGYKNATSLEVYSLRVEDVNKDTKINGQDALKVYDAMRNQ